MLEATLFDHTLIAALTEPQRRRLFGDVRKSRIDGCSVKFMILSERCQVMPVWDCYFPMTYPTEKAAHDAAKWWEHSGEVIDPRGVVIKRKQKGARHA